jgi:CheY-like chemotaxis protein
VETLTTPAASLAPQRPVARVLVVDDDQAIRRLARRILEGRGYQVLTAPDGDAALCATELAMVQPGTAVHLVLTDIDMPGNDGYALGRQLALTWPNLPVVYMSGTTHGFGRRARLVAWEHFIEKPFSADRLLLAIDLALDPAPQRPETSGHESKEIMSLALESISHATEAARTAVAYLDEEERWALLQEWLEKETAGKSAKRSLKLEALRSIVCPRVSDREWSNIVREHRPGRWADELRVSNALAILDAGRAGQSLGMDDRIPAPGRGDPDPALRVRSGHAFSLLASTFQESRAL